MSKFQSISVGWFRLLGLGSVGFPGHGPQKSPAPSVGSRAEILITTVFLEYFPAGRLALGAHLLFKILRAVGIRSEATNARSAHATTCPRGGDNAPGSEAELGRVG